jgi:hypothetical protein
MMSAPGYFHLPSDLRGFPAMCRALREQAADFLVPRHFGRRRVVTSCDSGSYLAERNIGVFSTDMDSRDFKLHKLEEVIKSVMKSTAKASSGEKT